MRKIFFLLSIFLFLNFAINAQNRIEIGLKNNTPAEVQTKMQLQRLLKKYDLSKWAFTNLILIDEKSIPHSHPVLTLHTRHLKDDELLLSTYVHEQLHWFLIQKKKETEEAVKELSQLFPEVPIGFPEGGEDEKSTRLHLLVCYLEQRAVKELLGELKARQVMDFWATDHYTWVYKTVSERGRNIFNIMSKHKLIPATHEKTEGLNFMEIKKETFIVIYKPGAAWIKGKPVTEQPLKEHGKYLLELYQAGTLRFAGPFADDTGGAAVLEASNADEAKNLIERDPAVTSGVMTYEIRPWRLVPWENYVKN